MLVKCFKLACYDEDGWTWHIDEIRNPNWQQIEDGIRRLDKFCYPWVELHLDEGGEVTARNCLVVMGGKGDFWVCLSVGDLEQIRLFDPNKSSNDVDLWTSDQGFSDYEFHVSYDIELILKIAKHFADQGQALPEASWEF